MQATPKPHDPYAAFRHSGYRAYFVANFLGVLGGQMVATAVAWQLYERTGKALTLGLVGLALAVPHYILFLPAGNLVDRYDRKKIFLLAESVLLITSLCLGFLHGASHASLGDRFNDLIHPGRGLSEKMYLGLVYACLGLMGAAYAFLIPAKQSFFRHLVDAPALPNAVTWNSTAFQVAAISGPAVAGVLLKWYPGGTVFFIDVGISLAVFALIWRIAYTHRTEEVGAISRQTLLEGVQFVRKTPLIAATITLDLFAMLFGGVTALLPIFAKDILGGDSLSLGFLRAAPFVGAVLMAAYLAHQPMRRAGATLLWSVAGFGVATIAFGFSRNLWLSLALMGALGALDSISVILRGTLVQTLTPDRLLGRVQAVNFLFIISSNELGAFESGTVAELFGPVFSAVSGGIGTLLVVWMVYKLWPELSRLDRLEKPGAEEGQTQSADSPSPAPMAHPLPSRERDGL